MLGAFQAVHRGLEKGAEGTHAAHRVFLLQQVQRGQSGGAGHGVGRVGVAVCELEHVLRPAGGHEGVVDFLLRDHRAQGLGAVGHLLGDVHDVGGDAESFRAGPGACAAESGDDLVEDQQDVVLRADVAQALQVAHRRNHHPGRTRERFHDHGRDVGGVVQRDQVEQPVGQRRTVRSVGRRLAAEERACRRLGMGQVVGLDALAEGLAVAHHAAHRDAAEVHTVVALLAADQARLARLALGAPVGARHLERCVGRFRAGAGEKHPVQPGRHVPDDAIGQLERQRVAELERG